MSIPFQRTALRAARATGLFRWMRWRHRHELLVLNYHSVVAGVDEARERHPLVYRNAVSARHFERQMRHLRHHYRPLDGNALRRALETNSMPDRAVAVTFDDGLLNNVTVALPILQRLEIPAFFFLPTGFVDAASQGTHRYHWSESLIARLSLQATEEDFNASALTDRLPGLQPDLADRPTSAAILRVVDHLKTLPSAERTDRLDALDPVAGDPPPPSTFPADPDGHSVLHTMTWDQARTAVAHGVTLGGHTVNHEILARLSLDAAATEIEDSLAAIAAHTDQPGDLFAYPNGLVQDFSRAHQEVLAELGCRCAFTQIPGFNDAATDPLALRRLNTSPDYDLSTFCYVASGTKRVVDRVVRGRTPSSPEDGK